MSKKDFIKQVVNSTNSYKREKEEWGNNFISELKAGLAVRQHRADLQLRCSVDPVGNFPVIVKYAEIMGYPTQKDLATIVGQSFPGHEINWKLVDVDDASQTITLMLSPSEEVVNVASVQDIPKDFESIGACLYKRAENTEKSIYGIWTLKDIDGNLALIRNKDEYEVIAANDVDVGFKKGDVVSTPYGLGLFQRYDEIGNGFVQCGTVIHLVAKDGIKGYDQSKEKTKLYDFFAQIYGPDLAKGLVEDYHEGVKTEIFDVDVKK